MTEQKDSHAQGASAKDIFERCAKIAEVFGVGRERASYGGSDIATRIRADAVDYLAARTPAECSPQGSFTARAAKIIGDAAGSSQENWSRYDHDLLNLAREADDLVEDVQRKLIEANNKLIDINHALLNREDPDWKVLAAVRDAAFTPKNRSSAPAAPTGDTRSGERPPASAAMGHSAGAEHSSTVSGGDQ